MQITKAEVTPVELALKQPVRMAHLPEIKSITAVFVRLETRQGQSAWGCTVAQPQLTGEQPGEVLRACRECAAKVPDLHPTNIEYSLAELNGLAQGAPSALCAFDLAFHDLLSLAADMPLYRLLGGYRDRIQTSITVPVAPVQESVEMAEQRAAWGFRILKIKGGLDPELDVQRVKAIRRALPGLKLRLDADGGYTVQQALDVARALKEVVEMLEQPTPATDLQALIETTGLDPKVKETLAALQGQQIAVVKLQTQPVSAEEGSTYASESTGQPGIHLGWRSTLVSHPAGATYTYPLGTGQAWASPIEFTRVYVVSPPELDFGVDYPRLGADLSGIEESRSGRLAWKIDDAESPAFAVDEAYGDFGHIWRATYIKSNSGQDLVVTSLPGVSREVQRAIRQARVQGVIGALTWLVGLLAGLAAWVTGWKVVMPRRLGVPYRWREGKLYRDALTWAVLYLVINLVALVCAGLVLFLGGLFEPFYWLMAVVVPLVMLAALGLANAFFYARWKTGKLQVRRGRAFGAYMLVVLMANALYLAFAAGYSAIAGAV